MKWDARDTSTSYLAGALRVAHHVAVGYHGTHVVALVLAFNHRFISPNTKEPICKLHELYMYVACSYYCYRACGRETAKRFFAWAKKQKAKAIRIYATETAARLWRDSWGFRESETLLDGDGNVIYGPSAPSICIHIAGASAEKRKTYPNDPSLRMTLIMP